MPTRSPVSPDFQALILCGPGLSLNTFTSTPEDFPKALVPIANRPMVWYPLDWCYRMNVSSEFEQGSNIRLCTLVFLSLSDLIAALKVLFASLVLPA